MSDQDSQRSRGQEKKIRDDKDVISSIWPSQVQFEQLIDDIAEIQKALTLAQMVDNKDAHIIPKDVFPEGIVRFVEKHGAGYYLKLFLKLNYEYLMSPTRKTWDAYDRDRQFEFEQIRRGIISELKFDRASGTETIDKLTEGCFGLYDNVYIASEMIAYR